MNKNQKDKKKNRVIIGIITKSKSINNISKLGEPDITVKSITMNNEIVKIIIPKVKQIKTEKNNNKVNEIEIEREKVHKERIKSY